MSKGHDPLQHKKAQPPPQQTTLQDEQEFTPRHSANALATEALATPPAALKPANILSLQRVIGNQAVQRMLVAQPVSSTTSPHLIQRTLISDYIDAAVLSNWSRAVTVLDQFTDADMNAQLQQASPEELLGLQRAAQAANLTRITQAIQARQLGSGTQIANVEGTRFRTPVTLFQNGVIISKGIRFVRRGRFSDPADFDTLKNRIIQSVTTFLTNRYKLKIETPGGAQPGDGEYTIRVQIIDEPAASYQLRLHGQRHGRGAVGANSGDIYELGQAGETVVPDVYLAHECSHIMLGAHDEYAEAGMPASRQVFTDHSLMGAFYSEGMDQAEIKPRHFGALVTLVSGWFPGRTITIIQ